MGHTCPDCDQMCYCCGDIDDIDMGYNEDCTHCLHKDEGEDDEWEDMNDIMTYQESGLKCEECESTDALKCGHGDEEESNEPWQLLCGKHAAEAGYCCCCGQFCAGMTSFDFHHPGYCDNCYDEVMSGEDDDCDEY